MTTDTPTTHTATPTRLRIRVNKLTAILDAANETWRVFTTLQDDAERLQYLRIHVRQINEYLTALQDAIDDAE